MVFQSPTKLLKQGAIANNLDEVPPMKFLHSNACSTGNMQEDSEAMVQLGNSIIEIAIMEMRWDELHKWNTAWATSLSEETGREAGAEELPVMLGSG